MLIENALSDAVRFFHIDALSSSVGFKVDFDMALLVLASGLYRLMAHRMRGYNDAQARQIFRDLIDMPADVAITEREITVASTGAPISLSSLPPVSSTNPSPSRGGTAGAPLGQIALEPPAPVRPIEPWKSRLGQRVPRYCAWPGAIGFCTTHSLVSGPTL